eukprot:8564962-Pyramimonas_sp.AAC.2
MDAPDRLTDAHAQRRRTTQHALHGSAQSTCHYVIRASYLEGITGVFDIFPLNVAIQQLLQIQRFTRVKRRPSYYEAGKLLPILLYAVDGLCSVLGFKRLAMYLKGQ